MPTQRVYLWDNAYVDRRSSGQSFYGTTEMPTDAFIPNAANIGLKFTESKYSPVRCAPLLQFLIPSTLKYKKFTNVKLYTYHYVPADPISQDYYFMTGAVSTYKNDGDLHGISYSNIESHGELAPVYYVTGQFYSNKWDPLDVTPVFQGALIPNDSGLWWTAFVHKGTIPDSAVTPCQMYGKNSSRIPYLEITFEDVPQLPPTLSYPSNVFLREGQAVLFSWQHNSETIATQQSYTLEYKTVGASSYTVVNGGADHSYTLQGGLPAGDYVWRVKIVNDAGETSDYSAEASFSVVGKPASPVIGTPENKALTRIEWNASDQNAFDLTLTDSDGRTIVNVSEAGNSSRYAVNQFLKGTYTVGIRIKNSIDLWSDWSYKTFTIDAEAPAAPSLIIQIDGTGVRLTAEDVPNGARIAFLRSENGGDYKVIAVDETDFVDRKTKARTKYTYIARAFADGFADSDPSSAAVMLDGMCLNSEGLELHLTVSSDKYLAIGETVSKETSVTNYSGREFALVERGEFTTWELERRFFVTEEQREVLEKFLDVNSAFYRDSRGRAFACAVLSIKYNEYMDEGYIVTISLTRIDEEEVIINV